MLVRTHVLMQCTEGVFEVMYVLNTLVLNCVWESVMYCVVPLTTSPSPTLGEWLPANLQAGPGLWSVHGPQTPPLPGVLHY